MKAIRQTKTSTHLRKQLSHNCVMVLVMVITVIPIAASASMVALFLAEHTPILQYLSKPLVPLIEFLCIPEATKASEAAMISFTDMYLPSILATSIENDSTRFFTAALSIIQVIYISETGALMIASKIPISFSELLLIFFQRTIIGMPVIALMTHLFF